MQLQKVAALFKKGLKQAKALKALRGGPGSEEASLAAAAEAEKKAKEEKAKTRSEIEEGRRRLYELLEKVEGCSHVTDVPTRYLLHDGDLVEMDVNENTVRRTTTLILILHLFYN